MKWSFARRILDGEELDSRLRQALADRGKWLGQVCCGSRALIYCEVPGEWRHGSRCAYGPLANAGEIPQSWACKSHWCESSAAHGRVAGDLVKQEDVDEQR